MITSYAQNFEDVMLWRALKHVSGGCYVDVGAQHPVIDSVSRLFYEQGWRGVHVEPVAQYADLLRQDRPDETVLQVALCDEDAIVELNVIRQTGLSTAVSSYAQQHVRQRYYSPEKINVTGMTLRSALPSLAGRDVHWLKIDVEGLEEKVIRGWDSKTLRPWIMVIEATVPGSNDLNYTRWEGMVVEAGYRFVYFDGLNRFYVAKEHDELAAAFAVPPNVFDRFTLSGLASSYLCTGIIARQNENEKELLKAKAWIKKNSKSLASAQKKVARSRRFGLKRILNAAGKVAGKITRRCIRLLQKNSYFRRAVARFPRIETILNALAGNTVSAKFLAVALIRKAAHFLLNTMRMRTPRMYGILSRSTALRSLYAGVLARIREPGLTAVSRAASATRLASIVNMREPVMDDYEEMTLQGSLSHAVGQWPLGRRI